MIFSPFDAIFDIAPNFPADWEDAKLKVRDIALQYHRKNREETLTIKSGTSTKGIIRLPLRSDSIESVTINDKPVDYRIEPAIGRSYLVVETVLGNR